MDSTTDNDLRTHTAKACTTYDVILLGYVVTDTHINLALKCELGRKTANVALPKRLTPTMIVDLKRRLNDAIIDWSSR